MLNGAFSTFVQEPDNPIARSMLEQMLTTAHQHAHSNQTRKAA
jgi:hypothetical protein